MAKRWANKSRLSAAHPQAQTSQVDAYERRIEQNRFYDAQVQSRVALNKARVRRNALLLAAIQLTLERRELKNEIRDIAFEIDSLGSADLLEIEALERERASLKAEVEFLNAEIESICAEAARLDSLY